MKHAFFVGVLAISTPACMQDVPETPSFQVDVLPILAANCVRCHGYPATAPPSGDRFDSFENLTVGQPLPNECGAPSGTVCGASTRSVLISERVQPGFQGLVPREEDPGVMPPRFPLADSQIETLVRWADQGATRGMPRPNNRSPEIEVEPGEQTAGVVTLAVRVGDPDRDLVVGELFAIVGGSLQFVAPLRSGHVEVAWTAPNPGTFPLRARLDDGAGFVDVMLGDVEVR